jgi:lysophospholipase L1-like esterase
MHHRSFIIVALALLAALVLADPAAAATDTSTTTVASHPPEPLFSWSLKDRFGPRDRAGKMIETPPSQVDKGPWRIVLRLGGAACKANGEFRWSVDGRAATPIRLSACRFGYALPKPGSYRIGLDATVGGNHLAEDQQVVVRDLLIVSLGDSVASGEGVPDRPGLGDAAWQSRRCHRSAKAGPAAAARLLEEDDPHTSVTFVHLACSGATVPRGLIGPYPGVEPPDQGPELEAQVDQLNRIEARRPVDAVLISIGANDIHFGDILRFCLLHPAKNCFEGPLPVKYGGDGEKSASEVVAAAIAGLEKRYDDLDAAISPQIPRDRIHPVEYFDPTRSDDGNPCNSILLTVTAPELRLAESEMLGPLNEAIAAAVQKHKWDEVTGIAAAFRDHGYCADQTWITTLHRSALDLGGGTLLGHVLGMMHPNEQGYVATGNRIAAALESDLLPGQEVSAHSHPGADDGGGTDWVLIVVIAVAALVVFLVLGIWHPLWNESKENPFWRIGKTALPLILPLLVLAVVGSFKLGPIAIVLICVSAVLASFFVLRQGWKDSEAALRRLESDLKRSRKYRLRTLVIVVAVLVIGVPIVRNTPYFETVNDISTALVLLTIVLWFGASALRLVSYADSRWRALIAIVAGLALIRLGMAVGVLPGEPQRQGGIPDTVVVLGAIAALLVLAEIVLQALPKRQQATQPGEAATPSSLGDRILSLREPGLKKDDAAMAKALGLIAVMGASVALFASTVYGLFESGERGRPLNPPEEVSLARSERAEVKAPVERKDAGELVRRYAPVLAFTKKEPWTPIAVDGYLADARLLGPDGEKSERGLTRTDLEGKTCAGGPRACFALTIECESGLEDCAHRNTRSDRSNEQLYEEGAVYTRIVRRPQQPNLFGTGPFGERFQTLVQYWFFYYFDEWRSPVFAGLLTQLHQGDWEVVSVGLDEEQKPLFVADSAHCSGSWRYWSEVEVSKLLPRPYVHPLVGVAEGSHANYPDPAQKRTTDPAHCAHLPDGIAEALSFASNIRDKTEYGWAWYPKRWIWARRDRAPMSFPGSWGEFDRTVLKNFNTHRIGSDKHGPESPPLQGSWAHPVAAVFCTYRPPPEHPQNAEAGCPET